MKKLFALRAAPSRAGRVKTWVTECLGLTEADLVTVAELACHEPGCPPVESVVAVHTADGARRNWRVHRALAEIDQTDIPKALPQENRA